MTFTFTPYEYVRLSYRGVASYADGLPVDLLQEVHVKTQLDDKIAKAIKAGRTVVLTGNPGDGKTHLLRIFAADKANKSLGYSIINDASELSNEEVIVKWKAAAKKGVPICIAINEAVLKELADSNPTFLPVCEAQKQVERAITYIAESDSIHDSVDSMIAVFDLNRRSVISAEILNSIIHKFTGVDAPDACNSETNDFHVHAQLVRTERFASRIQILLERIAKRGHHCTMREVQGFVSYLLCRGLDCDSLSRTSGTADNFVAELIFSGEGALFDEIRKGFDPGRTCHPVWDVHLVSGDIAPHGWCDRNVEIVSACDIEDIAEIERRRRRFFFFHEDGDAFLKISDDPDFQFEHFLNKRDRDLLRDLIPLLNAAFRDKSSEELRVWKCHRFDHSDETTLCSNYAVARKDLEVLRPRLCKAMADALEYVPDHIILRRKGNQSASLKIDFQMFEFLRNTEYGLSIQSQNNHVTRRLWRFMEQLAASGPEYDGEVDLRLLDLESGTQLRVSIDLDECQYLSIQDQ